MRTVRYGLRGKAVLYSQYDSVYKCSLETVYVYVCVEVCVYVCVHILVCVALVVGRREEGKSGRTERGRESGRCAMVCFIV